MKYLFILQQIDVSQKVKNAPDDQYQIGLAIGSYLPFILMIGLAYFLYYKAKKRNSKDKQNNPNE